MRPVDGRRRRAFALFVATLVVGVVGLYPQPASADQISDKQAQANAIAAKVDDLNHQIGRLAEQANAAQMELDALAQQVAESQAKVETAKADQAKHAGELRTYAISAYVTGSQDGSGSTDDYTTMGARQGYLNAASGNRQQLIDQLRATEEDVRIQIGQLEEAKAKAEATTRDLNDRKAQTANAAAEQKRLLDQAKGELATLVQQAQQKRAAEQAAAAQARNRQPAGGGNFGPAPSVRGSAGDAIAAAQAQLGKPYQWGAAGPGAYDCSGLTMYAWRQAGVSLPHYSGAQYSSTTHIPLSAIQPGDLIFYESPGSHVALYVGGGRIIHAPHEGGVVQYDSLYYWNTAMMASRP